MGWKKTILWIIGIVLVVSIFNIDKNFLNTEIIPEQIREPIRDSFGGLGDLFDDPVIGEEGSTTTTTQTGGETTTTTLELLGKVDCTEDSQCVNSYGEGVCIDGSCFK